MNKKELKQSAPKFFKFLLQHGAVVAYIGAWNSREVEGNWMDEGPLDDNVNNISHGFGWTSAQRAGYTGSMCWTLLDDYWTDAVRGIG